MPYCVERKTCVGHSLLDDLRSSLEFGVGLKEKQREKFDKLDVFIDELEKSNDECSMENAQLREGLADTRHTECIRRCAFRKTQS